MALQISARKLREWMVYAELEPFGPPAAFWQSGLVASTIVNVNRAKKRDKLHRPEDFMPAEMVKREDDPPDVGAQVLETFHALAELQKQPGMRHGE